MPELRFRDGNRVVTEPMAVLMVGLNTRTMTYQQALDAANRRQLDDHVQKAMRGQINDHLRKFGGSR